MQLAVETAGVTDRMSVRGATPQCRLCGVAIGTEHAFAGRHSLLSHNTRTSCTPATFGVCEPLLTSILSVQEYAKMEFILGRKNFDFLCKINGAIILLSTNACTIASEER